MNNVKVFNGLLGLLSVLIMSAAGLYVWANHFEQPYLYYQNLPFPAMASAKPGEAVPLSVERCNRTGITQSYNTTHALKPIKPQGSSIILPSVKVEIAPGCHRSISKINVIPPNTKPGVYSVSGIAEVRGMFRRHEVPWYSEPFEVIEK